MPAPSRPGLRIQLRVKRGDDVVLGPGRVELLETIERTGSISAAARAMGMSYRHAWLLIDYTSETLGERMVETSQGGPRGGGAALTAVGRKVVRTFRRMERRARSAIASELESFAGALGTVRPRDPAPSGKRRR